MSFQIKKYISIVFREIYVFNAHREIFQQVFYGNISSEYFSGQYYNIYFGGNITINILGQYYNKF